MASIRERKRADGAVAYDVVYLLAGRQASVTFDDGAAAEEFLASVRLLGAERAMKAFGIAPAVRAVQRASAGAVADWVGSPHRVAFRGG